MLDELNKIKYRLDTLKKTMEFNNQQTVELNKQLSQVTSEMTFIIEAREYYRKAVDIVYERSIKELKDILNSALQYIFFDENYSIEIELTDKRGKSLNIRIFLDGKPANLKRGTGMGVKTVISAVLHMYYLQCKNSKVLMLDEAYSAVSAEYVDRFFDFLHQMCEKLGFKIILITHDERLLKYGDKRYIIDKGEVTEE
jgi:DNA repair exonuclease SbcCD ATPase subunit